MKSEACEGGSIDVAVIDPAKIKKSIKSLGYPILT
jgi:hypothetical protein